MRNILFFENAAQTSNKYQSWKSGRPGSGRVRGYFWAFFFTLGSFGSGTDKAGLGKVLEIGSGTELKIGSGSGRLLGIFLLSGRPDPVDPTYSFDF